MSESPIWDMDEDGYPSEESESNWDSLDIMAIGPKEAAKFLVDIFPKLNLGCASISLNKKKDDFGHLNWIILFSTGGWSGAETVIYCILRQFWIRHFHWSWRKGGHYQFRVPVNLIEEKKNK